MKLKKVKAKSVLTSSKLPGADFVVNPYVGCSFGCQYCYAAFIGRWKHPDEEWGEFLDIKVNASEILEKELIKYQKKLKSKNFGSILFSSVTDPYLPQEAKYQITRKCLKKLVDFNYKGEISILTKSPLVTRDIDLLKKLKKVAVGLTITGIDDKISKFLENRAPPNSSRLKALEKLNQEGVNAYAFIGPILPHSLKKRKDFEKLFKTLEIIGTEEIWLEHINLSPKIKDRLFKYLAKTNPSLIPEFERANTRQYRNQLEQIIHSALKGKNLKLAMEIIYHQKLKN